MNLWTAFDNKLCSHYAHDRGTLLHARFKAVMLLAFFAIVVVILSVFSVVQPDPELRSLYFRGAWVGLFSATLAIFWLGNGSDDLCNHMIMAAAIPIVFFIVYWTGGVPFSTATQLIVVLPILAMYLYGYHVGLAAGPGFLLAGFIVWYLEHVTGTIPTLSPPNYAYGTSWFLSWITGYTLIFLTFASMFRENIQLRKLLQGEKSDLQQLAYSDQLTGLTNARGLHKSLDRALLDASTSGKGFHLIYIDLNFFKKVNDTYGHSAGDQVLAETAKRLRRSVRESDTVARVGGDEFAILVSGKIIDHDLSRLRDILRDVISEPISHKNQKLSVSASIGMAHCPTDGKTQKALIEAADLRMYDDKSDQTTR